MPLEALPRFLRFVAGFEPLRQIFVGVRSILYFDARGPAGLTRAWIAGGLGLIFWLVLGTLVTQWYDHKRLDRMPPNSWSTTTQPSRRRRSPGGTPAALCRRPTTEALQ